MRISQSVAVAWRDGRDDMEGGRVEGARASEELPDEKIRRIDDLLERIGDERERMVAELSMSTHGLRHKTKNTIKRRLPRSSNSEAETTVDIESQLTCSHNDMESLPRKPQAQRVSFPTRVLLRKIATAVLTNLDNETLQREDTETILILINHIKEFIFGIIIAFVLTSSFLFFDHLFGLRFSTARHVRKQIYTIMNDQETLHTFEESAGLKLMRMENYESTVGEIEGAANKTRTQEILLKKRSDELVDIENEMDTSEFPALFASLNLDKFCEQCIWGQKTTCIQRVVALKNTYNTPKFQAILSAMDKQSCWKSAAQLEGEKKQKELVETLLKNWAEKREHFCANCLWDGNMSCYQRASYLHYNYGTPFDTAFAQVMVQTKVCDTSVVREEETLLSRFCDECKWGHQLTCSQRVGYLKDKHKVPERKSKLSAMERPACVREKA